MSYNKVGMKTCLLGHNREDLQRNCPECQKAYRAKDRVKNLEKRKAYQAAYLKNYAKTRRQGDINFRVAGDLRSRLSMSVRQNKAGSAIGSFSCSIEQLKDHLAARFYVNREDGRWMSWECYGQWHIDHIVPLASFDLTDPAQVEKACHFTNLQPLWAKDNLSKGAR